MFSLQYRTQSPQGNPKCPGPIQGAKKKDLFCLTISRLLSLLIYKGLKAVT